MQVLVEYEETSKQAQNAKLLDDKTISLVKEYCSFAAQAQLSEQDANRFAQIIEMAEEDGCLEFWINEVDHFLDHELGLVIGEPIYPFDTENQKAVLLEHLNFWSQKEEDLQKSDGAVELLEEIHEFLKSGNCDIQNKLHQKGFDPGPIDGVVGPRTQETIIRFQKANRLTASGQLDTETLLALGYGVRVTAEQKAALSTSNFCTN